MKNKALSEDRIMAVETGERGVHYDYYYHHHDYRQHDYHNHYHDYHNHYHHL